MKYAFTGLFLLLWFFSSASLDAKCTPSSHKERCQAKMYFDENDLEISESVFFIHLEDKLIETNAIRTDRHGFYIFEDDIASCKTEHEKKWKCPYCYRWSPVGKKCQNPECPSNKW